MLSTRKVFNAIQLAAAVLVAAPILSFAMSASGAVPLDSDHWVVRNDSVEFQKQEGIPQGLTVLKGVKEGVDPVAALIGPPFDSGTIEFDVKPDGGNWPTVRFHKADAARAEEFYVRPSDTCSISDDCTQYAPIVNGLSSSSALFDPPPLHVRDQLSVRCLSAFLPIATQKMAVTNIRVPIYGAIEW